MKNTNKKSTYALIFGAVVVLLAGYFIINGNIFSKKKRQVMNLEERAVEYNKQAELILEPLLVELSKDVSPYQFILKTLKEVERYTWMALDIDTTMTVAWRRLGYINSHIHGKQALLRYESYKTREMPDKVIEEEKNAIQYFAKAELYYNKALEFGTTDSADIYFLKSEAAGMQHNYDWVVINLNSAIHLNPENRKYRANIIEAYLNGGRFPNALNQIDQYKRRFPDSDIPYLYLAGYHYNMGDTLVAIQNYEIAIEKGTKPEVGKFLHHYYTQKGEVEKADFYLQKAYEANTNYNPEKY